MRVYENVKYREDLEITLNAIPTVERLRGKCVFVAGATGLIGSFLVEVLLYANETRKVGIQIVAHSRKYERLVARFGAEREDLEYVIGDICEPISNEKRFDYVIHLASNAYPEKFRKEPVETMLSNINGTLNLLKLVEKNKGCRLLYVSSGEVYGETTQDKVEDSYGYVDVLSARSCYPISKQAGETLCCAYAEEYGVDVVIARPCHVYGASATEEDNRASTHFIRQAVMSKDIIMNSSGSQVRSYAYVADAVSGIITVLLDGESTQAYNVAPNESISIREFAEICADEGGCQVRFMAPDDVERKEQSPISSQVLVNDKLIALGWKGLFSAQKGIGRSIEILKEIEQE